MDSCFRGNDKVVNDLSPRMKAILLDYTSVEVEGFPKYELVKYVDTKIKMKGSHVPGILANIAKLFSGECLSNSSCHFVSRYFLQVSIHFIS